MKLHDGTVVSRAEVSAYKFGGDPMAEYLYRLVLDGDRGDEYTGDAVDWNVIVHRFGKRLLLNDSQGFVWVAQFDTDSEAAEVFAEIEAEYAFYEGSEW